MSAFLCSSRHISVIVNSVNTWADLRPAMSSGQCFTLLSHANLVSVNYRYEHNAEALNEFAQEASRHREDTPHSGAICLTDMLIRREGKPPRHLDAS